MFEETIKENFSLIKEYILEKECKCMCSNKVFNCKSYNNFEDCYIEADIKCNDDFNDVFAKAINYGGYNDKEEFWEQLLN